MNCINCLYLLTIVSNRIARTFNRSWATTQVVALDISKAYDRVWHTGLLQKLTSYGFSGQILGLISSFLNNIVLGEVLDEKSYKNIQLMLGFLRVHFWSYVFPSIQ